MCSGTCVYTSEDRGEGEHQKSRSYTARVVCFVFILCDHVCTLVCGRVCTHTHTHTRMSHIDTCANRYLQSPKDCEIVLYFPEGGVTGVFELSSVVPGTRLGSARMASARNH